MIPQLLRISFPYLLTLKPLQNRHHTPATAPADRRGSFALNPMSMTLMLVQNHSYAGRRWHRLECHVDTTGGTLFPAKLSARGQSPKIRQLVCVCDVPPPFFSNWWLILICGIQCNVGSVDLKFTFCPIHQIRNEASYCSPGRTINIASCLYFICLASWQQKYNIHAMNHDAVLWIW